MARLLSFIVLIILLISGCYKEMPIHVLNPPDYEKVFPPDAVQRLDIVIEADDWASLMNEMTSIFGSFGKGEGFDWENTRVLSYIPCTVIFEGKEWQKVGIRTKGYAPLGIVWTEGGMKFAFKLDFDEFEDTYPRTRNQRFFGFRQLSLKNAWGDGTTIREGVVNELFRDAGLPVARSAYYEVFIEYGEGMKYAGLYTLVEDVDDTVLPNYFNDLSGHLYKPEGEGAHFSAHNLDLESFAVHSDTDPGDYQGVKNVHQALHNPIRNSDPVVWKQQLDAVFDTGKYLKWLACNRVVQNWDVYGAIAHNYYLYQNPESNKLTWIPWDHDNALKYLEGGGTYDFTFSEIGEEWPLIKYLIENPDCQAIFKQEVANFIQGPFREEQVVQTLNRHLDLVEPFVVREVAPFSNMEGPHDFQHQRHEIIELARKRYQDAWSYVNGAR